MKQTFFSIILSLIFIGASFAQEGVKEPDKVPPPPPLAPISEAGVQEMEQFFQQKLSDQMKKYLEAVKKYDKKRYQELLFQSRFKPFNLELPEFEVKRNERDQKIWELEVATEALGLEYQNSKSADKSKLEKKLQKTLTELFDLREASRQAELKLLEKEMTELKEALKVRMNNKNSIIEQRFRELTGQDKYLHWD